MVNELAASVQLLSAYRKSLHTRILLIKAPTESAIVVLEEVHNP